MKHILWDWNGTLLDDTQAALDTLNIMLARRGRSAIGMKFYRDHFSFPVRPFYDTIGMSVPDDEWDALAQEYHDTYHSLPYGLNRDAFAALELVRAEGAGQSVISALHQRFLDEETAGLGVARYMDYVYGTDNLDGGSKLARARELLSRLVRSGSDAIVLIGDSIHDFEVARDLGVACVLYSGGSHSRARLEPFAPVGDTLEECVRIACATWSRGSGGCTVPSRM